MSLYRVKGIYYVDLAGKSGRHRETTGTSDRKQAQAFHERVKEQLWRESKLGESPAIKWGDAMKNWLEAGERGMPDRYRLRALNISLNSTLPLSDQIMADALSGMAAGTFNRALALVVAIHNASGIAPPKVKRKPNPQGRTRWLSSEEWTQLQKKLAIRSPLLAQAAEFTLATGLRENNVLELEWSQVDLNRAVAWIYADQAKARHNIGVPLNDDAMAVLTARQGIDKRYVFGNPDYPLTKASNKMWYLALKDANLVGFRWHDLRHTWASWHVMNGTRLEELAKLGGWQTLQMVQRYAHLAPEHLAAVAANVKPVSMGYNTRKAAKK